MRTILFSLLLASVASTSAMAAGPFDRDSHRGRAERSDSGDSSPTAGRSQERSERPSFDRGASRDQQPRFEVREQAAPRTMSGDPGWQRRGGDDNAMHAGRDPRAMYERGGSNENIDQVRQRFERRQQAVRETRGRDYGNGQLNDGSDQRRFGGGSRPQISGGSRPGTQPQVRYDGRRSQPVQWNRNWRGDNRYDWQNERRRNGFRFHIGAYYDPFGWNYQRFQIGWRLYPDYYSSRYWINDPWQYRLPYAPPGLQWIRYYDDALLVDTWSGQVVDSIPNFFW